MPLYRNHCYTILSLLLACLAFTSCVPEGIELPSRVKSVVTGYVAVRTPNSAQLTGTVSLYDTEYITCGIIYGTSSELSSTNGTKVPTAANGNYLVSITGLSANTTYYYRAYAVDAGVYRYGEVLTFKTMQNVSVKTGEATSITCTEATLEGRIYGTVNSESCGIIYGISPTLSSLNNRVETSSNGTYSVKVSNLNPSVTYYYCAYVTINGEERYGEILSFTTQQSVSLASSKTYTVKGVSFTMIVVEGGTFTMGSPDSDSDADSDEKPAHQVTLSSYYIGETEVTQALWKAVMGSNPSYFTGDLQHPVERVKWNDCQTFISKLNELTGESFRLPTEAEWEYAARGGNKSKGYKYSGSNTLGNAWYDSNSSDETHAVKTKQPNELGIYDMSGNVWEWCSDWYGEYSSSAQTNPTGPSSGSRRVLRGGSWCSYAWYCRVAYRNSYSPGSGYYNYGLRLALQFIP